MAGAGAAPAEIVARWRADGARLKLDVADLLDLHRRGVSVAVLDALLAARETALRTDADSRLAALQARHEAEIAAERARPQVCPPSVWRSYPIHPYGGWRSPGGWWGGLYWGW